MLRILVNAYACSPDMGSEPGMGWNWCSHIAKHCELHIITEGEFRDRIESVLPTLLQGQNMHFYYLPVTERVRKMCWNQGDWRFYYYYRQWQKRALEKARDICQHYHIDIIHQLNMVGFREPGYLWSVSKETNIPFVWGPVGGLKQFPMAYADGGSWKMRVFLHLKNRINICQLKYGRRVNKAIRQSSLIISSIPDSYQAFQQYKGIDSVIIPETGTFVSSDSFLFEGRFQKNHLTMMWVGKFDFRKRLDLAIRIVAYVKKKNIPVVLKVFGTGNEQQIADAKELVQKLHARTNIQFMGNCTHERIVEGMQRADLFLFTSVNEDTSTVVLESVSNRLPVLCFDTCGMSNVITESVGIKIPLTTPEQSIRDFAEKIIYLYHHRDLLTIMSENCKQRAEELSWDNKAKQMVELYRRV